MDPAEPLPAEPPVHEAVVRAPILRAVLIAVLGGVVGLVCVDLGVRYADRGQAADGDYWEADPYTGFAPRGHFRKDVTYKEVEYEDGERLDSLGLRSDEIPADAPADEIRILATGASRMYGKGAPQEMLWNYVLEEQLRAEGSGRVLNGAVMAYSIVQSCRRAEQMIEKVQPDLVLVACGTGAQHFIDTSASRSMVRVSGELVPARILEGWPESLWPFRAAFHQVSSLSAIYTRHQAKFAVNDARDVGLQRWIVSRGEQSPGVQAFVDRTYDEVEALVEVCEREGVALRFLVLPELSQSADKTWRWYLRTFQDQGAPPRETPRHEPTAVMAEEIEARGGVVWSLAPEIERMGTNRPQFLLSQDDQHWTELGHELVSRTLLRFLREERLLADLVAARAANPRVPTTDG